MDFSQIIQGTRQFFQGHPGKSRDNLVNSEPQLIETKCGLKKNEPYSYNSTSYSDVIKLNYPDHSSYGTASLPQYYPRPYCEQITYQQKFPSSYQANEACEVEIGAKYASCAKPIISQLIHKPAIQYEEHSRKNNILPKVCDPLLKMELNQIPTFSTAPNANRSFCTSVTYQGQQQQVPIITNEFIVPETSNFHQGYVSEAANYSQYSEIVVRQPFVQSTAILSSREHSCTTTNVYQTQNSFVHCPENANSMNFRDQIRQQTFSKSLDSAPSLLSQTEHSSTVVSRDCLFNQNNTLLSQSNQQHIIHHEQQQWDPKTQCFSIENHKMRQNKECARSAYPQEQPHVLENREITRPLQNPHQNYHSQELSKIISKNCAFIPLYASVKTKTLFCSSTSSRPDQTTSVTESSSLKTKSNIGNVFCGVSVIQHSMNKEAISVGVIPKNEERMSVISYPRQRGSCDGISFTHHISNTKCAQFESIPINATVSQPRPEPSSLEREGVCPEPLSKSIKPPIQVNAAVVKAVNSSQLVNRSPNKATKSSKLKVKSFRNSVNFIQPSNAVLIDTTLVQSDPIVSDEKWEEWKNSFDTEWDAFVKDLANSGNIKRIYRVSQPAPKKIKRLEDAIPKPIKSSVDFKPSKIEDFASDEDIPLSLRRKVKEEQ